MWRMVAKMIGRTMRTQSMTIDKIEFMTEFLLSKLIKEMAKRQPIVVDR